MKTCLACLLIAAAAAVRVAAEEFHPERAASTSPLQTTATESGTDKGISASASQLELTGQIFIVTKGHESIKLGLVTVQAFDPAQVNASIESTKPLIANEQQRLNEILPEIHRFYEQTQRALREAPQERWKSAMKLELDAMKVDQQGRRRAEYLKSAEPFFEGLPQAIASAKTDADGKFRLQLPEAGDFVVGAVTARTVGDELEQYFWLVKVTADGKTSVTLSNDNLADASSPSSVLHTNFGGTLGGKFNTEAIANEFQQVLAKAHFAPSSTAAVARKGSIGAPASPNRVATPARDPNVVTLTRDVSINVQYRIIGLRVGTKLPPVSRRGETVRVRYTDGTDYDIPISATDLQ